ncbi:MAG: hypothetical protein QOD65_4006 [Gaiellales bacterium]|jgi:hypothetical protein|nr:hypothetical protein [Gaiellales bacterium]
MAATRHRDLTEAAAVYTGYLKEAYGFAEDEVAIPDAYRDRELDWFGDLNETLTELEDYSPARVRTILTERNPWTGGATLLEVLRRGDRREVRRVLRRY